MLPAAFLGRIPVIGCRSTDVLSDLYILYFARGHMEDKDRLIVDLANRTVDTLYHGGEVFAAHVHAPPSLLDSLQEHANFTVSIQCDRLIPSPYGAQPDRCTHACVPYQTPWNIDMDRSEDGGLDCNALFGGEGVVVYVVDGLVDIDHKEFEGRASVGLHTSGSLIPTIHGTAVAGIIAGKTVGVAPRATILSVEVGRETVTVWHMNMGLWWILMNHDAPKGLINLSIGREIWTTLWIPNTLTYVLLDLLVARGLIIVSAAPTGNVSPRDSLPTANANVVSVSMVNRDLELTKDSPTANVDVYAPGEMVVSCTPGSSYSCCLQGTSYAAPHVAGVMALTWGELKNATAFDVSNAVLKATRTKTSQKTEIRLLQCLLHPPRLDRRSPYELWLPWTTAALYAFIVLLECSIGAIIVVCGWRHCIKPWIMRDWTSGRQRRALNRKKRKQD